jgi:plasmid maintenance system antidote protein VapI
MTESNGLDMKNPTDSGCFVLSSTIEPMDLSIAEAAKALGITHVAFSRFVTVV